MSTNIQVLRKSELFRNALKLSSSNILLYVLPLIVTPILSRLYSSSLFADWGVFSGIFSIISTSFFLCYENAIIQAKENEYKNISILAITIAIIISVVTYICIIIGSFYNISFFNSIPNKGLLLILLITSAFIGVLQNIANRKSLYWTLSINKTILGLSQAIFRIVFGIIILVTNGIIFGTVIAYILCLFFLIWSLRKDLENFFSSVHIQKIIIVAKKYIKYPIYETPATLLQFATLNLPVIILVQYYDKYEVGCFFMIIQLMLLPISLVGAAVGKVYFQQISFIRNDLKQIKILTYKVLKFTSFISILPTLFLVFGGDKLLILFLGDKWILSGKFALILTFWSIPVILTQPVISIYRVLNKQDILLLNNIFSFISSIGCIFLLSFFSVNILYVTLSYSIIAGLVRWALYFDIINRLSIPFIKKTILAIIIGLFLILLIRFNLNLL